MTLDTSISIIANGVHFNKVIEFKLNEQVGGHAEFSVSVRSDYAENILSGTSIMESSRNFLGKECSIEIRDNERSGYNPYFFKGIITHVKGKKGNDFLGMGDILELKGYSVSLLLDTGKHMNAFTEQSLSEIIENTIDQFSNSLLKVRSQPVNDALMDYSVQHNQTAFEYLQHLAATQGEYLFYSQDTLYFGMPNSSNPVTLKYGFDLKDFSLGLATAALNFTYFTNDYLAEINTQSDSSSVSTGASGYTAFASDVSNQLYSNNTQKLFPTTNNDQLQQRIDAAVSLQKKVSEQQQVTLYGESSNTGVSLGSQVDIISSEGSFGRFRITKVDHTYGINGTYSNTFEAVPIEIDVYPLTDISKINKSEVQVAVVKETNDPDGMSRIKVQFPWQQTTGGISPWLRMATSYAGSDRGFHFIPEVGDSVLIGYENGNVERPYVQSALYTGVNKASAWQTEANNIKAIQTRTGNKVLMNDEDGSITIADPSGNVLVMQGNGEIVMQAPNKITMMSKDINIVGSNSVNIHALPNDEGGDGTMSIYAQRDLGIETADEGIGIKGNTDVTITSVTASANLNAKTDANLDAETINIQANKEALIHGGSKAKIAGGKVEINKG